MYSISYERHSEQSNRNTLGLAIETVIREHKGMEIFRSGNSSDITSPSSKTTLYEIGNEGTILHSDIGTSKTYAANIHLVGFDENREEFGRIRSDFEALKDMTDKQLRDTLDLR